MNIFKKIKEFYSVPDFKKLDRVERILYVFSFAFPALLLLLFFYFYLLPFGYNKEYSFNNEAVLEKNKGKIYFSKEDKKKNGLTHLTFNPWPGVRNPLVDISVEGDSIYLLPRVVKQEDILNIWEYGTSTFNKGILMEDKDYNIKDFDEFVYGYVDDYTVKDSNVIAFQIDYEPFEDIKINEEGKEIIEELPSDNQLIFKYGNLRVIQNSTNVTLRVDEVYDGELYTYVTVFGFENDFFNMRHVLTVVYEKPTKESNGYIELIVNDQRVERTVVVSPYNLFYDYDDLKKYEEPVHENLIKDLNQNIISLGQEMYRVDLEKSFDEVSRRFVDLNKYNEETYKTPLLEERGDDMYIPLSLYYEKPFFNYFKGKIYEIRVGYDYPFKKVQSIENELQDTTPFSIPIAGDINNIEGIELIIKRDAIWEKLGGL